MSFSVQKISRVILASLPPRTARALSFSSTLIQKKTYLYMLTASALAGNFGVPFFNSLGEFSVLRMYLPPDTRSRGDWLRLRVYDTQTKKAIERSVGGAKFTFGATWVGEKVSNHAVYYSVLSNRRAGLHLQASDRLRYHRRQLPSKGRSIRLVLSSNRHSPIRRCPRLESPRGRLPVHWQALDHHIRCQRGE